MYICSYTKFETLPASLRVAGGIVNRLQYIHHINTAHMQIYIYVYIYTWVYAENAAYMHIYLSRSLCIHQITADMLIYIYIYIHYTWVYADNAAHMNISKSLYMHQTNTAHMHIYIHIYIGIC